MTATPAAEPIDSRLPPTPAVSVISSQWPWDMSGSMVRTANMTGMLSITADTIPKAMLAQVAFQPV